MAMRPDNRSISFTFHSGAPNAAKENVHLTRQCLEHRFDNLENASKESRCREPLTSRTWRSNFSLSSLSATSQQTGRRVLRSGTEKISRTFSSVKISFDELTQKLRRSTRRRHRFAGESPNSPRTPGTRSRKMLGRTPTKMYSPFSIDTPRQKTRAALTPTNKNLASGSRALGPVYSPHQKFASDVAAARKGVSDLDRAAQNIVRKSIRN